VFDSNGIRFTPAGYGPQRAVCATAARACDACDGWDWTPRREECTRPCGTAGPDSEARPSIVERAYGASTRVAARGHRQRRAERPPRGRDGRPQLDQRL